MPELRLANRNILIAASRAGADHAFAIAHALSLHGANIQWAGPVGFDIPKSWVKVEFKTGDFSSTVLKKLETKIGRTHVHGTLNMVGPKLEPENALCSELGHLDLAHTSAMVTRWAGFKMLQTGGGGIAVIPAVEGDSLGLSVPTYDVHAATVSKHAQLLREEFRGNLLAVHTVTLGYLESANLWSTEAGQDHLTAIKAARPMLRSIVLGELCEMLVTIFQERQPRMAGQGWHLGSRI